MIGNCSFAGCENVNVVVVKGLCAAHYQQQRRGRALEPIVAYRYRQTPWLEAHIAYEGDACLIWPFSKNREGRAYGRHRGTQSSLASRVMCELAHGAPPSQKHEAAHSCGNGHKGCVNPKHLRWATPLENAEDKRKHGTQVFGERVGNSKLTERQVLAIRELTHNVTHEGLSHLFGTSIPNVSAIVNRRSWRHI